MVVGEGLGAWSPAWKYRSSTLHPFIPSIPASVNLMKYVSAWVSARSENPWELKQSWRPRVWEPVSGQLSYAVVAANSGFLLQWPSHPHICWGTARHQLRGEAATYWATTNIPQHFFVSLSRTLSNPNLSWNCFVSDSDKIITQGTTIQKLKKKKKNCSIN